MSRKRVWKLVFTLFAWVICLSGLVVLMSFIEGKKAATVCTGVKVYIPGNQYFIDRQEVDNILHLNNSYTLVGRRLDGINTHDLENKLKANPFIEFAKVYTDMDGLIRVEIRQRRPILRVINRFNQDFYVDENGLKMPLSSNFTARVLAANGNISELFANRVDTLHTPLAISLYKTAAFIHADSLWDAMIAQMFVNRSQEIELIPRVGNQRIILGNADSLDVKFKNLLAFYQQAMPKAGWDKYKALSIKYSNQVIGIKAEGDTIGAPKQVKPDTVKKLKDTSHIKQQ